MPQFGRTRRDDRPIEYRRGQSEAGGIARGRQFETFVHLGEDGLQIRFVYFTILIPDSVTIERCRRPPRDWRAQPPESKSMRYGSAWLRGGRTAVLEVPSAIVPSEKNYLLNPGHPDFPRIRLGPRAAVRVRSADVGLNRFELRKYARKHLTKFTRISISVSIWEYS